MNMSDFLPARNEGWLNNTELRRLGGRYSGRVLGVRAEELRNPFPRPGDPKVQMQPVIYFEDDRKIVPNVSMRTDAIARLGDNTKLWVGQQLTIALRVGKTGAEVKCFEWTPAQEGFCGDGEPQEAYEEGMDGDQDDPVVAFRGRR